MTGPIVRGLGQLLRKARKLAHLLPDPLFRHGLRHGVAAAVEHRRILTPLGGLGTVIDVGAHTGQFSLLAARLFPDARIHAVEPLPAAAAVYDRVFADAPIGRGRITVHRAAAGAEPGMAALHVSRRSDCSSLLPIGGGQVAFAPGSEAAGIVMVPVEPLDRLLPLDSLPRPILLKLDVQGGELDALRGAGRLLSLADHVYAEVSFVPLYEGQPLAPAIVAHLAGHGFGLAGVNTPSFGPAGGCVQADLLFRRTG